MTFQGHPELMIFIKPDTGYATSY